MFIGHYGFAFGLKSLRRDIPLWLLVAAVLLPDIVHFTLLIFGIERFVVDPTFTRWVTLRPVYYAISHGLLGIMAQSLLAIPVAVILARRSGGRIPVRAAVVVLWLAVFSHFVADFLTHPGTLPLAGDGSPTIGLGLWNYPILSNLLELGLFAGGLFLFVRTCAPLATRAKVILAAFAVVMVVMHLTLGFVPPVNDPVVVGVSMLAVMGASIGAALFIDRSGASRGL